MNRLVAALASALAVGLSSPWVFACPCQGSSGPAGAVTSTADRFGVSLTETGRNTEGAWGPSGRYARLAPGERYWSLDVTGVVGYRPIPVVEIEAETAFGHQSASSPDFASAHTGVGDSIFRFRWDALDEPMPYVRSVLPWPAVSLVASIRAPTASLGRDSSGVFSGTSGSVGSAASSEGLGAWETSLALGLTRSISPKFLVSLAGEAAYRFPDSSLGLPRHLAPRLFVQAGGRYAPTPDIGVGVLTDLTGEGDVSYDNGPPLRATSERLWAVGLYGYFRVRDTGFRCGTMFRFEPPLDDISRNATRATSLSVSLGYALQ